MCGIAAAAVRKELKVPDFDMSLKAMDTRGPEAEGTWTSSNSNARLGHKRLSIVDLSASGNQPMHNEDKSIWVVCNGEIYNYPNLRSRLEGFGHKFYSNSDSEAILHAYEQWGVECLIEFVGMFAFALWDENKQRLFAARDRIGIKPLCYKETKSGIFLASVFSALLPLLEEKPSPDPLAIAYVMTLGYIPCPYSIWKGTYKLDPGHFLLWSEVSGLQVQKYWEPPCEINYDGDYSEKKWAEFFGNVLKDHLLADVPMGLFLSGGLDSTSVALGLENARENVTAFTISFPGNRFDEAPVAKKVADYLGMNHIVRPIEIKEVDTLIDSVSKSFDEPQGYGALLTMYAVSEITSREFKAVLSGDGGDECFAGYTWYLPDKLSLLQTLSPLFQAIRKNIRWLPNRIINEKVISQFYSLHSELFRHAWRVYPRFLPEEVSFLFQPINLKFDDELFLEPFNRYNSNKLPRLRKLQRIDLMTFCSGSILPKVDRASMAHSLEVRVPFLDHRIIEWALQRPLNKNEHLLKTPKQLIRKYLNNRVPKEVLTHPKQGFSMRIMNSFNWNSAIEVIRNSWWVQEGFWNKSWSDLIKDNTPLRNARIFNLYMLAKWANQWMNQSS